MIMSIPVFLLFSIYGVVSTYLPLFLRTMGYSASNIGFLLAVFEISGVVIPFVVSPLISKKGIYGLFLLASGLLMVILPYPLLKTSGFSLTAGILALYAAGFKGIVPVSDSLINRLLGEKRAEYGRVRVMGSIGFVVMSLILQYVARLETADTDAILLWMVFPPLLFSLSIILIPGLLKRYRDDEKESVIPYTNSKGLKPVQAAVDKKERLSVRIKAVIKEFPSIYWAGMFLIFSGFLGLIPANKFFSLYVYEYLGMEASGLLWALAAAAEIPFMFFSSRFLRRFGSMKLIVFGTFTIFLRVITYILIPNFTGAVIGQLFNSITYGLYHPAAVSFAAQYAPKNKLVVSMTLYSVVATGLANIAGNCLGGIIIDAAGYPMLFIMFSSFPLFAVLVYLFYSKTVLKKRKRMGLH